MDLAQATGAVETIDLAGEEFRVRLLTLKEWGELTAWLKRRNPSPLTRAARAIDQAAELGEPLSAAAREQLLEHAQRAALSWPPRIGSQEWLDALDRTDGGHAEFIYLALSKTDPAFTRDHAEALAGRFVGRDFNELLRVSFYGTPTALAPKARPAAEAAAPSPTTGPG